MRGDGRLEGRSVVGRMGLRKLWVWLAFGLLVVLPVSLAMVREIYDLNRPSNEEIARQIFGNTVLIEYESKYEIIDVIKFVCNQLPRISHHECDQFATQIENPLPKGRIIGLQFTTRQMI